MTGQLSRRTLLSAGGLIFAGCSGRSGMDDEPTVTPAAVPTTAPRPTVAAVGPRECPELPSNAEVYICSPRAGQINSLRLVPSTLRYEGTEPLSFTLRNRTGFTFRTGCDWWTIAADIGGTWKTVAQGPGEGRLAVPSGEPAVWRLRSVATGATAHRHATLEAGTYAFVVTGYAAGGELTAVAAPFTVAPAAIDRDGGRHLSITHPSTSYPDPPDMDQSPTKPG